jgi:hypothetical protein
VWGVHEIGSIPIRGLDRRRHISSIRYLPATHRKGARQMQIQEKRDQNVPTVTLSVDQLKRFNENYKFLANFCSMILNVPLETMCKQDFIDFGNIAART